MSEISINKNNSPKKRTCKTTLKNGVEIKIYNTPEKLTEYESGAILVWLMCQQQFADIVLERLRRKD